MCVCRDNRGKYIYIYIYIYNGHYIKTENSSVGGD